MIGVVFKRYTAFIDSKVGRHCLHARGRLVVSVSTISLLSSLRMRHASSHFLSFVDYNRNAMRSSSLFSLVVRSTA